MQCIAGSSVEQHQPQLALAACRVCTSGADSHSCRESSGASRRLSKRKLSHRSSRLPGATTSTLRSPSPAGINNQRQQRRQQRSTPPQRSLYPPVAAYLSSLRLAHLLESLRPLILDSSPSVLCLSLGQPCSFAPAFRAKHTSQPPPPLNLHPPRRCTSLPSCKTALRAPLHVCMSPGKTLKGTCAPIVATNLHHHVVVLALAWLTYRRLSVQVTNRTAAGSCTARAQRLYDPSRPLDCRALICPSLLRDSKHLNSASWSIFRALALAAVSLRALSIEAIGGNNIPGRSILTSYDESYDVIILLFSAVTFAFSGTFIHALRRILQLCLVRTNSSRNLYHRVNGAPRRRQTHPRIATTTHSTPFVSRCSQARSLCPSLDLYPSTCLTDISLTVDKVSGANIF